MVLAWLTPVRSSAQDGPTVAPGDLLVRVGDTDLIPLTPDDVPFDGRAVIVWPLSGDTARDGTPLNKIVLARVNPASLSDATRARAVDDIVAYSAICTHSGCEVDESLGESQTFFCSCHGSIFDPRDSGMAKVYQSRLISPRSAESSGGASPAHCVSRVFSTQS